MDLPIPPSLIPRSLPPINVNPLSCFSIRPNHAYFNFTFSSISTYSFLSLHCFVALKQLRVFHFVLYFNYNKRISFNSTQNALLTQKLQIDSVSIKSRASHNTCMYTKHTLAAYTLKQGAAPAVSHS